VLVWCWPAEGNTFSYFQDEKTVQLVAPEISNFVAALLSRNASINFEFMAHSMGARILLPIMAKIASDDGARNLYSTIFAAPDEDRNVFEDQVRANRVINTGRLYRIGTLYASDSDAAIKVSAAIHGMPRAGSGGGDILVMDGVDFDSIEAGELNGGTFGHAYVFDDTRALRDLGFLLVQRFPAVQRHLEMRTKNRLIYWILR
jgi:esterase/lipase superfamily enzyme